MILLDEKPKITAEEVTDVLRRSPAFGRKPTFKNIHTLTPQEVESLKGKK